MSKELKPYEKENIVIRKLRECKNSKQYLITQKNATEKGLERCKKTYERDIEAYTENLEKTRENLEILDQKIADYSNQLKEFLPKPKTKITIVDPQNGKVACKHCGKKYSKSGIKSHQKACLKKIELAKLQEEIEKLELEETLEELSKGEQTEIIEDVEEIIEDLEDSIDLDQMTEDVSFLNLEPKEDLSEPKNFKEALDAATKELEKEEEGD